MIDSVLVSFLVWLCFILLVCLVALMMAYNRERNLHGSEAKESREIDHVAILRKSRNYWQGMALVALERLRDEKSNQQSSWSPFAQNKEDWWKQGPN